MSPESSISTETPHHNDTRLTYLPGLDGLRALAVIAVMLYHAGLGLRGGFLGVEVFFVLSGYLITALLAAEWRQAERIDLAGFWMRRARRLLPALLLLLAGTLVLTLALLPNSLATLGVDALAALGFVMNWQLIATERSYFDPLLRPPLLQHLWSLAVEEQFYLLWPLVFVAGMRFLRRPGLLAALLAAAAASVALMATGYRPGADPSRIYYGTDTRASALLLGSALALAWSSSQLPGTTRRRAGAALDVGGSLALLGVLASFVMLHATHPLLYRGGFALVALATTIVIAAVAHPQARLLPRLLGWAPLRWVGLRSYSLYLWHWPVLMLTRPGLDLASDGLVLQCARLAAVVVLADLSYRWVEMPVRRGALTPLWQRVRGSLALPALRWPGHARLARTATALFVLGAACAAPSSPQQPAINAAGSAAVVARPAPLAPVAPIDRDQATAPAATPGAAEQRRAAAPLPTEATAAPTRAAATAATPPPPTPTPFDPALAAELQGILDAATSDGAIPGAVLAVQLPGREPWTSASGAANIASGQPMEPTTLVRLASVSKLFTAVVVLQLAEEGVIDLDAPVATYLPELLPDGDVITVRHLLQHRSGLYDYLEDVEFVSEAYRDPNGVWAPGDLVAYAAQFPLTFAPGAEGAWDYSNTNYVVLGMLVEQVTGKALADELRGRILDPLGLAHTFVTPQEALDGVQAHGYAEDVDHTRVAMSFVFATGNIVSTAGDLQRFADALFGGELLNPESFAQMTTFVGGNGQYGMPDLAYGLGLMRNQLPAGPRADGQPRADEERVVLGHIGGFGGFRSAVWHAPQSGITIALSINQSMTDPNLIAAQILDAILAYHGS